MSVLDKYCCEGQMSLFDPDTWCGRMFLGHSAQIKEPTSKSSLKKQPKWQKGMPAFLDLRAENGPAQERSWEMGGALLGEYMMRSFGECPQRRKRIALVADFGGQTAPEILFESKSVSGDTAESIEQGQGVATDARTGIDEASKCLNGWDVQSKHIQPENGIAESLYAGECRGGGGESYVMQSISFQERAGKPGEGKGILIQNERTGALSTLNNQSIVYGMCSTNSNSMKSSNPHSGIYKADTSRTLDLNGGNPACNQGGMIVLEGNGSRPSHQGDGYAEGEIMYTLNSTERHAVAVESHAQDARYNVGDINQPLSANMEHDPTNGGLVMAVENHPADSRVKISEDGMVQTLSSRMGTGGGNVPMVMEDAVISFGNGQQHDAMSPSVDVAKTLNCMDDPAKIVTYGLDRASFNQGINAKYDFAVDEEKVGTQVAMGPGAVCSPSAIVRRLTPLECERLQGYPDYWTDIGDWIDSKGKKHKGDSDAPRYKALGNSIALPFWQWMAERMCKYIDNPTMASLFDGIGGFPLVFSRSGCKPVWASEIEEFPIAVTKIRFQEDEE